MDVRGRRLSKQSEEAAAFTSSMASDGRIAAQTVRVVEAHVLALTEAGAVAAKTGAKCVSFLSTFRGSGFEGIEAEDFHQYLEQKAVDALGVKVAGYLNLGKSRNDQVATAIRMELRSKLLVLVEAVASLQRALLEAARESGTTIVPGYTHLQRAQPVTFAHYCLAHFDACQRDVERLFALYSRVNLSPMGSAALAGTSVALDRGVVASLLGFEGIVPNAMDAVSSRDFVIETLSCAAMLMLDLSRLCEEIVLWSSREFGFLEVSDEYATSSSIMPQKKNPVVAELARAKSGSVIGSLMAVCAIVKALPYSYNLDLQEATPHLWRALDDAIASATVVAGMVGTAKLRPAAISESMKGDFSTATSLANYLVSEKGLSFREAHAVVGELVTLAIAQGRALEQVAAREMVRVSSRVGRSVSIDQATAARVLEPTNVLASITTVGGANPGAIPASLNRRSALLRRTTKKSALKKGALVRSDAWLRRRTSKLAAGVKS